jgi:hypothetical protein
MIKTPIARQDLKRKIYTKAKADTAWRFGGLCPEASGLRLGQVEEAVAGGPSGAV